MQTIKVLDLAGLSTSQSVSVCVAQQVIEENHFKEVLL